MRTVTRATSCASLILVLLTGLLLVLPSGAVAAGRITGGDKAPADQYQSHLRSIVALVSYEESSQYEGQFCAGTLIDELHVLTAGHCLVEDGSLRTRLSPTSFGVLAGTPNLNRRSLAKSSLVPVQAMFINPNFNVRTMRWDVAVLRLARPITNVPVTPLLSGEEMTALGIGSSTVQGLVAGWGDQDPDLDDCCFPSQLNSVSVPLHPDATCMANLRTAPYLSFTTEFQLCAGRLGRGARLGADSCQGDSGGPLFVDAPGGVRLAGVTSFGVGCGQQFFGVYARATTIMPWLASIPGVTDGDTREPVNGPGDLAAPTVQSSPKGFSSVHLELAPGATGAAPTSYTIWLRVGPPAAAQDIFLGTTTSSSIDVRVPPLRRGSHQVLVRAVGESGEGPTGRVAASPRFDRKAPSRVAGLRVANGRATWRAARDPQSGIQGYYVQLQVKGRWRTPKFVEARRFSVGSATRVRVRAVDWADNLGAWSAPVAG